MIVKEWLEDIKERFAKYQTDYNLNGEDVEWLIQQVERFEKENKRLREALEFYANEKSWMNREVTILMDGEPTDVEDCPAIFDDGGNIARKALEGSE